MLLLAPVPWGVVAVFLARRYIYIYIVFSLSLENIFLTPFNKKHSSGQKMRFLVKHIFRLGRILNTRALKEGFQ